MRKRITNEDVALELNRRGYISESVSFADIEWVYTMLREERGLATPDRTKSRGDGYSMSYDRLEAIHDLLLEIERK